MIERLALAASLLAALAIGTMSPTSAQDSPGSVLPRDQQAGVPSSAPTAFDCRKKTCIYLVNLSNHRVTEFRYATRMSKAGMPI